MEFLVKVKKIKELSPVIKTIRPSRRLATERRRVSELSCFHEAVIRVSFWALVTTAKLLLILLVRRNEWRARMRPTQLLAIPLKHEHGTDNSVDERVN